MKKNYFGVVIFTIITAFLLSSCDDSGVNHLVHQNGIITFTQKNLLPLNPNVDGVYELWLRLDSSGIQSWYSLGKFNIGPDGKSMVDLNGQPMTFTYNGDTTKLSWANYVVVSIENLNVNFAPSSAKIITGPVGANQDSVYGSLYIGDALALDAGGRNLYTVWTGHFTIQTPTTGAAEPECLKGIWLSNVAGDASGLDPSISLIPGNGWVYEAWVADSSSPSNPIYYSAGRFYNPAAPDLDGTGPCAGPNAGFNFPGQDWVQPGCPGNGKPDIVSLAAGYYRYFITIEPELEVANTPAFNTPFPFFIYRQYIGFLGCRLLGNLYNIPGPNKLFPDAKIHITN
ncbi:MAG: hypothetical protein EHM58_10130 [Ignavibacteriae bacterium]|nr:MAG: hypothetical protein EHM58_10130 [Ignavibacteriota bacterium]